MLSYINQKGSGYPMTLSSTSTQRWAPTTVQGDKPRAHGDLWALDRTA